MDKWWKYNNSGQGEGSALRIYPPKCAGLCSYRKIMNMKKKVIQSVLCLLKRYPKIYICLCNRIIQNISSRPPESTLAKRYPQGFEIIPRIQREKEMVKTIPYK